MRHLSRRSRGWLFGLAAALMLVLLDVFLQGPLVRLDLWVIQYDGERQHPALQSAAQIYDKVGQRSIGIPILLIVAGILGRRHRTWRPVWLAVTTVLILNLVVGAMKVLIGRAETETGNVDVFAGGVIFPSGHSSNMVLTGGLIVYLVRRYTKNPPTRLLVAVVAVLTTLTIATSIYIGSHWVTDLIGGVLVGGLLLQAVIVIDRSTTKPPRSPLPSMTGPAVARNPATDVVLPSGRPGGLERDRDGVDAVPITGRRLRRVIEEVAEVRSAPPAPHFRAAHEQRTILD